MLAGVVLAGAAAAYAGLKGPALVPQNAIVANDAIVAKEAPRGSADPSSRPASPGVGVPRDEAQTVGAPSAPQLPADPEPAVATTGSTFQRRLATAGLPDPDANAIGTTDAPVTAFPPNAAVEPEPPSSVPPAPETPVAATHESAAAEPSQTKASPPQPNPKLDALVARAEQLLAAGDVTRARQFFGRIAADGDARGALGMARSYDEQILRTLPAGGLAANPAQSQWWYEKAKTLDAADQPDRGGPTSAAR
ncbi:hypothetical protein [Methylobacterium haplocladii]|uniref:Uncharacterized protein n=1 Tax=Methylobacterium haplocladii TaxID=1176176 RepID=A0A512IK05_9HYPH|nr:hypothetical protein [Methylobacterium haplocladii]GEO98050.1 hypothetical protein MHA02_04380 [Methylobacterium haplocladii]GJD85671.1 hypothetical protein HPGCJGGD_3562 [Methylobacterium haplocladii]GLS60095.1 hypothetical protein GCM10007887_27720 [Methylobacterium haplocladii]